MGIFDTIKSTYESTFAPAQNGGEDGQRGFDAEYHLESYFKANGHDVIRLQNNGPVDLIIDGENIQVKWHETANSAVNSCFENGEYKYYNDDGSPMVLMVPSDQEDEVKVKLDNRQYGLAEFVIGAPYETSRIEN